MVENKDLNQLLLAPAGLSNGSSANGKSKPLQPYPDKNPGGDTMPSDPTAFFPLTKDNMRTNLPLLLRQFFTYDFRHLQSYKAVCEQLFTPDARFQYPLAEMNGKDAVIAFWVMFLAGRAVQFNDVHSLHIDVTWDEQKLQALVQLEAWQHIVPLAWLDRLFNAPGWKVWSTQVMQFVPYPSDGPGALRISFQEELHDQFVFLGIVPLGLYSIRTDPGTVLHTVRTGIRRLVGHAITVSAGVMETALQAVGLMP